MPATMFTDAKLDQFGDEVVAQRRFVRCRQPVPAMLAQGGVVDTADHVPALAVFQPCGEDLQQVRECW